MTDMEVDHETLPLGGGGVAVGALAPQDAHRGAVPPQPEPCQYAVATRPDYDSFHEYRQLQSVLYLTYSSFLHCYSQETLVYLSQVQTLALHADAKLGAVFTKCGRGPKTFARD